MRAAVLLLALAARAASLDGTVTNSATGGPVKKARVSARGAEGSYQAMSDPAGRWSIAMLPAGDYEVTVECQGFLPPAARRPRVHVPDDGPVAIVLTPLAVIAGKVVDDEGDPVANVTLFAMAFDYTRAAPPLQSVAKATTDDRGEYRLFDLKPGRYYVQAVSNDKTNAVLYHAGAMEIGQAAPVDLAPGTEAGGIDFRLRKTRMFRIRGTMVHAQTGEAFRALVIAEGPGGATPRYSAQAQEGGFEFPAVQPGTYRLTVSQNSGPKEMFAEHMVTVASRDVEDVRLAAIPVADVAGSVLVRGPAAARMLNLRVTLNPAERAGFSASALPKQDGTFSFSAAPQLYLLDVYGIAPDLYLREVRFGAEDASSGRIDLRRGPAPLTLVLAPNPGAVGGTVQSSAGKPAAGVLVAITPADPEIQRRDLARTVYTDAEGRFSAPSLAPGEYRVFAWEQFDPAIASSFEFRRLMAAKAVAVTVREGQEENVRLPLVSQSDTDDARRRMP